MSRACALILVLTSLLGTACARRGGPKPYDRPLAPGQRAVLELPTAQWPRIGWGDTNRAEMAAAIDHSLSFLDTLSGRGRYPVSGITHEQVVRGLRRFRELLDEAPTDIQLQTALQREFRLLMSVGWDGRGEVLFTGYYTPIFAARRQAEGVFQHPLYRLPPDLVRGEGRDDPALQRLPDGSLRPYPGRREIDAGLLRGQGLELVYLPSAFDAYIIQVQGSARLRLADGSLLEVGYAGTTNHPYLPVARELIQDGHMRESELNLATMRRFFEANPHLVQGYIDRNPRYVFFTEAPGGPFGSLGRPVTTDISIATDKHIFPPGALSFVVTSLGGLRGGRPYAAFRLDQDSGGAIRAPGRCDLFMGIGPEAERRAGGQYAEGRLYYLIAR